MYLKYLDVINIVYYLYEIRYKNKKVNNNKVSIKIQK